MILKGREKYKMKSYEFDEIATNVFGRAYPIIADQAVEQTGIAEGICMDLGSGGGHLGLALAERTGMEVYLYDISEDAVAIASNRIIDRGLEEKVKAIKGDVESIPLKDNAVDLIISRGSLWFWNDKFQAFKEIYRVLKPSGKTYIGGGFGNAELKAEIDTEMRARSGESWQEREIAHRADATKRDMEAIMKAAEIRSFELVDDESGYWVIISKEESK